MRLRRRKPKYPKRSSRYLKVGKVYELTRRARREPIGRATRRDGTVYTKPTLARRKAKRRGSS